MTCIKTPINADEESRIFKIQAIVLKEISAVSELAETAVISQCPCVALWFCLREGDAAEW